MPFHDSVGVPIEAVDRKIQMMTPTRTAQSGPFDPFPVLAIVPFIGGWLVRADETGAVISPAHRVLLVRPERQVFEELISTIKMLATGGTKDRYPGEVGPHRWPMDRRSRPGKFCRSKE